MPDPTSPAGPDTETVPKAGRPGTVKRPVSMLEDPVVRIMAYVAAGLLILYLAGIVGALVTGVIQSPAPRTAAERALYAAESVVKGGDHSSLAIANYVNGLTGVGQYGLAQDTINTAPKSALGSATGDIETAQCRLYLAEKEYKKAITAADAAMKIIKDQWDVAAAKPLPNVAANQGLPDNYYESMLIKGAAQQGDGDANGAIATFTQYLQHDPQASDVLVQRATSKLAIKDTAGAKADFQEALKFQPDNQVALDGLKTIGARP